MKSRNSIFSTPLTKNLNYRWLILGLLILIGYLNQFDRQTVSVLKTTIKAAFEIDDSGYALLVNAFTACYAIAYMFSGWVVDRIGPRLALSIFLLVWSAVTIGCGVTYAFLLMIVFRAFLGFAEPGIFPVMIRASTTWAPDKNRGVFMSLASIGTSIGSITAVPVISWLTIHFHWRASFLLPGIIGILLAIVWFKTYKEPESSADKLTSKISKAAMPRISWEKLWSSRPLWGLILVRLISDPVWYFCLFWMPGYLQESKDVSMGLLGFIGWIPFLCGTVGGLAFTALSDLRARDYGLRGRKHLVMLTAVFGPLCMLVPHTGIASTIIIFCIIAVLCNSWLGTIAPLISQIFPVGNVGSVYGIAGAFGATGAIIFNWLIGQAANMWGMDTLFVVMGCLHPAAALVMWFMIRPSDSLAAKAEMQQASS